MSQLQITGWMQLIIGSVGIYLVAHELNLGSFFILGSIAILWALMPIPMRSR